MFRELTVTHRQNHEGMHHAGEASHREEQADQQRPEQSVTLGPGGHDRDGKGSQENEGQAFDQGDDQIHRSLSQGGAVGPAEGRALGRGIVPTSYRRRRRLPTNSPT